MTYLSLFVLQISFAEVYFTVVIWQQQQQQKQQLQLQQFKDINKQK